METTYVGKSVPRLDGLEKVTGSAVYTVDMVLPGMLHGAVLRSPYPHALIKDIDTTEAEKSSGVRVVVTGKEMPNTYGGLIKDQPFLAVDRVRYVGEAVAAVAAETEIAAQEALQKIRVVYQELPAVFDPREAVREGAPILHPDLGEYSRVKIFEVVPGTNVCTVRRYSLGNIEDGFREADEIFENEFYTHAVAHTPMETHAALAQFSTPENVFTIWSSTDRPYHMTSELVEALGLSTNQIRFISCYSGGGFGGKGALVAEAIAVALAKHSKGRPVKVVLSREEELAASQTRHALYAKLKTGVKRNGLLTACQADLLWDNGAYSSLGPSVAFRGVLTVLGPYRIPNLALHSRLVYTNKEIGGAYRGFGTTQVTWACETQMDIIAREIGIDPLEFRLKNAYQDGDLYINGQVLTRVGLKESIEKAGQAIGWKGPKPKPSDGKIRGRGIATMLKPTATPTDSYCVIQLQHDGGVTLLSGTPEVGAGQKTVLAQIAADSIGVPFASIAVPNSDTRYMPYDFAVASSRTTYHMGNAIRQAGQEIRKKILDFASKSVETDRSRLELRNGSIFDETGKELFTLKALLGKMFGGRGGVIIGEGHYSPAGSPLLAAMPGREGLSSIFWMFATHAAEVEVDIETGKVKVLRIAAAHDVGRAINPALCEQQIEGSVVMGLSNTLFEEFKMEKGRIINDTLADYKIASIMDLPEITTVLVETCHEEGPFGAKGVGEPAAACTAPAIANAIFDAVGVRFKDLPITSERVLQALQSKK